MVGYKNNPPNPKWPNGARLAVQFVLNYEEGGENNILHGDDASEAFLSEIIGAAPWVGKRHLSMESIYEYGSRVGVWRILDLFKKKNIPLYLMNGRLSEKSYRRYALWSWLFSEVLQRISFLFVQLNGQSNRQEPMPQM